MPVELRKRKAPAPPPPPPAKRQSKVAKAAAKVKQAVTGKKGATAAAKSNGNAAAAPTTAAAGKVAVGDVIPLDGFGGEIETHDGQKTTLKALVEASGSGVVLFTYPKASTPGCTTQACLFRDSYEPLTKGGLAIYGLSKDSPKANTTFKERQKLPYPLLCDPAGSLVEAIGLKKAPSGTTRGVFVIDKAGKVLVAQPGSPAGTVDVVKKLVESLAGSEAAAAVPAAPVNGDAPKEEEKPVDAAAKTE